LIEHEQSELSDIVETYMADQSQVNKIKNIKKFLEETAVSMELNIGIEFATLSSVFDMANGVPEGLNIDLSGITLFKYVDGLDFLAQAPGRCNRIYDYSKKEGIKNSYILDEDETLDVENIKGSEYTIERVITEQLIQPVAQSELSFDSPIIVCSPISKNIFHYFCKYPERLSSLTPDDFEAMMAEIYNKLGFQVERTPATHDGGKDIIVTKPTDFGDFIYYVECKKYSPQRPLGVGIVRQFSGTIEADRVNGGFLATTSYFSEPAKAFITEHNLQCRIKLHDKNYISELLKNIAKTY